MRYKIKILNESGLLTNFMLSYTNLKPGINFIKDGQPFTVLDYTHVKKQRGAPIVQLKIKNLISGKTQKTTVHQNESFEETEIEKVPAEFIYYQEHQQQYWFKNPENPNERFLLDKKLVGDARNYLRPGLKVEVMKFKNNFVSLKLPVKVDLKVIQAPPVVKGNTAEGGAKQVIVETDYKITTPLFIKKGDVIKVNTETGEYAERITDSPVNH